MSEIERPQRPRLSFPYWLALIVFAITLADAVFLGGRFILSPAYRDDRLIYGGVAFGIALLLWLWVVGSTSRYRKRDFTGPIQTVRGADSPFQPITAFVILAAAGWLAYSSTIPKLGHALADQRTVGYDFILAGTPETPRRGCAKVRVTEDYFGDATLCVPENLVIADAPLEALYVTGRRSDFGFWPEEYEVAFPQDGPAETTRKVAPVKTPETR
jgi:hypothetical protein